MATLAQISIEEYLQTSYRPDCEYIDGEVRERNMGQWEHSRLQLWLAAWFFNHEQEWKVLGATEWRTRVAQTRVRLPDLILVRPGRQKPVLDTPPVLIVEILSPRDSYSEMKRRVVDYQEMGVQAVWIIDPETRTGEMFEGATWTTARKLTVTGTPIYVELDELFRCLDAGEDEN